MLCISTDFPCVFRPQNCVQIMYTTCVVGMLVASVKPWFGVVEMLTALPHLTDTTQAVVAYTVERKRNRQVCNTYYVHVVWFGGTVEAFCGSNVFLYVLTVYTYTHLSKHAYLVSFNR